MLSIFPKLTGFWKVISSFLTRPTCLLPFFSMGVTFFVMICLTLYKFILYCAYPLYIYHNLVYYDAWDREVGFFWDREVFWDREEDRDREVFNLYASLIDQSYPSSFLFWHQDSSSQLCDKSVNISNTFGVILVNICSSKK